MKGSWKRRHPNSVSKDDRWTLSRQSKEERVC